MTTILFKIALIGFIVFILGNVLLHLPDAQPLPSGFASLITWLFNAFWVLDPIVNVAVFFDCVFFVAEAVLYYLIIKSVLFGLKWVFSMS